jgi:chromatin structure-remodeling complex subunit RSC9
VHGKPIDLYDLFHNIRIKGGYDRVSAEKLLWRKVAQEFNLNLQHAAASAFGAKTVYYKNLAYVY